MYVNSVDAEIEVVVFSGPRGLMLEMDGNDKTRNDVVNVRGSCVFWIFNDLALGSCCVVGVEVRYLLVGCR